MARCLSGFTILAVLFATAEAGAAEADGASARVTYHKDVAPIFQTHCVDCHRPGQIGPMSLLTYEESRPWAKAIRKAVRDRVMPPWFAEAGHQDYSNDLSMSEAEIEVLSNWASQGALAGNPADAPAPMEFEDDNWRIGTPDKIYTMTEFRVTDEMEDHYEHLWIKNDAKEDRWVKSIELKPGLKSAVHHILVFLAPEGADPASAMDSMELFGKWGPGNNPDVFPEGHGKLLPAGSTIMFQVHFHKEPGPETGGLDVSQMAVIYDEDNMVEHPITTAWILDPTIMIPAGDDDYVSRSTFRFIDSGTIYNLAPHMHLRGKSFEFIAEYPDGREEILLSVPEWDFNWQLSYYLKEPKQVPRGTKIHAVAHYDNSTDNIFNPDATIDIGWGDATTDEMMIGFMDYIYTKRKKFQRTLALPEGIAADAFAGQAPQGGDAKRRQAGGGE